MTNSSSSSRNNSPFSFLNLYAGGSDGVGRIPTLSSQDYSGTFRTVSSDRGIVRTTDYDPSLYSITTRNINARVCDADFYPIKGRTLMDTDREKFVPIGIFMDQTASMGQVPESWLTQEHVCRLVGILLDGANLALSKATEKQPEEIYKAPAVLLGAVGDVRSDQTGALQMANFNNTNRVESSEQIISDLTKFFLVGGGGGNGSESYPAAWEAFAQKVDTDLCEAKPIVFTIGDDSFPKKRTGDDQKEQFQPIFLRSNRPESISKEELERLGLEADSDLTTEEMKSHAEAKGVDLFHISVAEGSTYTNSIKEDWDSLLGEQHFVAKDYRIISDIVAVTILEKRYGLERDEALGLVEAWWEKNDDSHTNQAKSETGSNVDAPSDELNLFGLYDFNPPAEAKRLTPEERKAELEQRMETLKDALEHKVDTSGTKKSAYSMIPLSFRPLPLPRIQPNTAHHRMAPPAIPTSLNLPNNYQASADYSALSTTSYQGNFDDTLYGSQSSKRARLNNSPIEGASTTGITDIFRTQLKTIADGHADSDNDSKAGEGAAIPPVAGLASEDDTTTPFSLIDAPSIDPSDAWTLLLNEVFVDEELPAPLTNPNNTNVEEEDRKMPAKDLSGGSNHSS